MRFQFFSCLFSLVCLGLCYSRGFAQDVENLLELAQQQKEKGNLKAAIKCYDRAISQQPEQATYYQNRGALRYELDDLKGAIEDCEKALSLNKNLADCQFNLGIIYYRLANYTQALQYFNSFLKNKRNDSEAWYWRGKTKQKLNDKIGACADWREAKRLGSTLVNDYLSNYCTQNAENSLEK